MQEMSGIWHDQTSGNIEIPETGKVCTQSM